MARIRTIKPEFPQSQSMGKVSRDARLLFVNLWTIADDEGRLRAPSRLLASLLFPYDDDAPELIDGWIAELEADGCFRRYEIDGTTYGEITNWLEHQKIDKATKSRLPPFDEASRKVASPREPSTTDLGPRTMDLGPAAATARATLAEQSDGKGLTNLGEAERRVLAACGNSPNLVNLSRVRVWLDAGADLEADILPAISECRSRKPPDWAPKNLSYFDGPVTDAKALRTKPLPEGIANGNFPDLPKFLDRRPKPSQFFTELAQAVARSEKDAGLRQ